MAVLKFKDKDGVVRSDPGIKVSINNKTVGGNAELNIHYGDSEPSDKTKLWIKTNRPNKVTVSPEILGDEIITPNLYMFDSNKVGTGVAHVDENLYLFNGSSIEKFDLNTGELTTLTATLTYNGSYGCPAVVGTKIYTINRGGNAQYIDVFDTETETITRLGDASNSFHRANTIAIGNIVYFIEGDGDIRYCNSKNDIIYDFPVKVPVTRCNAAVAAVGSKIYLFGGSAATDGSYKNGTSSIYIIDTVDYSIKLSEIALPYNLIYQCAITIGSDIYLFGGTKVDYTHINDILVYDTANDTIRTLDTKLPFENANIGAALVGTDIYMVGGLSYKNTIDKFTLRSPLEFGSIQIQPTLGGCQLWKLMTNPDVEIGVKKVFVGNNDGYAEPANAYLFSNDENVWKPV